MSDEQQKKPSKEPGPSAITSVHFHSAVMFGGKDSVLIEIKPGRCERVFGARVRQSAITPTTGDERADGLCFERDYLDTRDGNKPKVERTFQPWPNIARVGC